MAVTYFPVSRDNTGGTRARIEFDASATSPAIDQRNGKLAGLILPASIASATSCTFTVSDSESGTFVPLYDESGNAISITVAASHAVKVGLDDLAAWPWVKLVMSQAQTAGTVVTGMLLAV